MKRLLLATSLLFVLVLANIAQVSTPNADKAKALIEKAKRYAAEQEFASVAQYLQQAYDISPSSLDCTATQLLGVSYYMMEDSPSTITFLEIAVECEADKEALSRMYIYLSDSYLEMGNYKQAVICSLKAIDNSTDHKVISEIYEEVANIHFDHEQADATIDAMQKSVAHYLKHLSITEDEVMQGLVKNEALGKKYFNLSWFASALKIDAAMLNSIIRAALCGNTDAIDFCQQHNIDYKDAIVQPTSSSKDDEVATALIEQAHLHASKEEFAPIIAKLEKAYRVSPAMFDGKAYHLMGFSYFNNKNYPLAIKYLERALQFGSDKTGLYPIYGTLSDAYFNLKDYNKALINAERALYLANGDADVLKCSLRLATIYYAREDYNSTVDSYQNAIKYYMKLHSITNVMVMKGNVKDKFLADTHMKLTSLLNDLMREEESDLHFEKALLCGINGQLRMKR